MENNRIYAFADEAADSIEEQINALLRNELNGIEIRNIESTNILDLSVEKAKEIKQKFEEKNLEIWSLGSPVGKIDIHGDFNKHLDAFKRMLEMNTYLGAKAVRLFSFFIPKGEQPNHYRDQVLEKLQRFVEAAKGSNVMLCHENEKGIYGDNAQRCLDIYQSIPEIKGVFDPANFIQCQQDTMVAWEMLKPFIHYLHIKDCLEDGCVVPAGYGIGNLQEIIADYRARGGIYMTIEPHLTEFTGLKALEKEEDRSKIGAFHFTTRSEAFDAAADALKVLLR